MDLLMQTLKEGGNAYAGDFPQLIVGGNGVGVDAAAIGHFLAKEAVTVADGAVLAGESSSGRGVGQNCKRLDAYGELFDISNNTSPILHYVQQKRFSLPPTNLGGHNKFGFCLPYKITLKPGQKKDVNFHLSLMFPGHANTIFRPAIELDSRNVEISLLNVMDGHSFIKDLIVRIKNKNQHFPITFSRKMVICTALVQNLYDKLTPVRLRDIYYAFPNATTNGFAVPIHFE